MLTSSSGLVAVERKEQKVFDCNSLKPSHIPIFTQDNVLSLLPKRLDGETDSAYRERLPNDMLRGVFDWWVSETGDATRHTIYCKV